MKTILILGATSPIGAALSEQFSKGNRIILSGRNQARLSTVADRCATAGSIAVRIAPADLAQTIQPIIDANSEWAIDQIIDAASAASGASHVRDLDVAPDAMRGIIQADVLSHLDLYQQLARLNRKHPDVAFISTVLAIVKTPGREIYATMKRMVELYLEKMQLSTPDTRILVFRVGKLVSADHDTDSAKQLAKNVAKAFLGNKKQVLYGTKGFALKILYVIHPALVSNIIRLQRKIRRT